VSENILHNSVISNRKQNFKLHFSRNINLVDNKLVFPQLCAHILLQSSKPGKF